MSPVNAEINGRPVGWSGANVADDAVVWFVVSWAIFSSSHSLVLVQKIITTEELALPPPPTCSLKHNAQLMNHEHIL